MTGIRYDVLLIEDGARRYAQAAAAADEVVGLLTRAGVPGGWFGATTDASRFGLAVAQERDRHLSAAVDLADRQWSRAQRTRQAAQVAAEVTDATTAAASV